MEDTEIYNELNNYDSGKQNDFLQPKISPYEEHWGTLLNFLDDSNIDEATLSKMTETEEEISLNQDIQEEVIETKPRNMAEVYKQNSKKLVEDRQDDNEEDYVYQSKKKAVVMIRNKTSSQMKEDPMNLSVNNPTAAQSYSKNDYTADSRGGIGGTPAPTSVKIGVSNLSSNYKKSTFSRKKITGNGGGLSVYKQKAKKEPTNNFMMSDKAIKENHLLRSMKKLKQQDDKTAANRVGVGGGKNENFNRMTTQLSTVRRRYGVRTKETRPNTREQKMLDQMYQRQGDDEMPGDLKSQFGGIPPSQLLAMKKGEQWMRKRNMLLKTEVNRKHIEFAKNLFLSWDDSGNGELNPDEIKKPFISMGLSADSKFASKLFEALASGNKRKKKADLKLTLQDFIKIFKSDKFSEQISQMIRKEIDNGNNAKINLSHTKPFMEQHLDPNSSKRSKKNVTISMKNENGIVEIPLDPSMKGQFNVYKRESTENGHVSSKKIIKIDEKRDTLIEENIKERADDQRSFDAKENINDTSQSQFLPNDREIMEQFNKTSSLTDQMKIVKKWWNEMGDSSSNTMHLRQNDYISKPIKVVASFMTQKGITPDIEKAKNVIYKAQLGRDKRQVVTFDEFNRIFCKGIFKDALINVVESIDKDNQINNDSLPLSVKISQYKRGLMIDGLMKEKSRYEDGKAILEALNALKREEDPNYHMDEMQLRAFMEDPYDKRAREREASLRHAQFNPFVRTFEDDYINSIKIIDPPTNDETQRTNFKNWKNTGVDEDVNETFFEEKQNYLSKLKEEEDRENRRRKEAGFADLKKIQKRPTLIGVADKIVHSLQNDKPYRPPAALKHDPNPKISVPNHYYSADRQTRLGEQSDLLSRFQKVVMHDPYINHTSA
ncbi:unnamed protein product [Moneuplotes crassus]|uniref:EF-hand domain-containing protein n=2 Tax=Euplotes crassus TaxID=5936 RepID=A0AAD2D6H7_EUPCR|nr:unnamed protein product [Moneuplotes crassus]